MLQLQIQFLFDPDTDPDADWVRESQCVTYSFSTYQPNSLQPKHLLSSPLPPT